MKKGIIILALMSALSAMTSAQASEFDGLYIGARAGDNRSDISGTPSPVSSKDTTTWGIDEGYNWDMQQFLLGVNFSVDANSKADHTPPTPTINYGSSTIGLGLKLGLPMGSWMPYVHAGFAKTKGSNDAYLTTYHFSDFGPRGGLGIEYKLAPNWSANAEWAYSSVSDNGYKLTNDNLTVGLKYYFAEPQAAPAPTPAPAPVVEKEAPVVSAPAPAPQPKESWKTILTEKPVLIEGANFALNSAKLLKKADVKLNEVVDAAKQYPEVKLEVSGHTDSSGKKAFNQKLSEKRAAAVKAWLVKHGVAADRISTAGYADTQPIADNKTKAGRAANRRVEVRYVIKEESKVRVTE